MEISAFAWGKTRSRKLYISGVWKNWQRWRHNEQINPKSKDSNIVIKKL
jgi:hypothetical protein